jgi:type VI secretion system ImpM family protein
MNADYLPLGCYGKLPCYGDFLQGRLFQPSSQAVKSWLHEGRAAVELGDDGEGTGVKPRETARRRFLYGPPGSAELMAGVIRPSSDQGERRQFPFMVFTHFPRRLYGKHYSLLPLALATVWDALDDAWDSLANVATKAAFEEVVRATLIPHPEPVAGLRSTYEAMQQESVGGMFDRDAESFGAFLRNMPEVIAQMKHGKGGEGIRLELPVSVERAAACFDAAFWIDLMNRQFFLRRFEPGLFLPDAPGQKYNRILMVFGILSPTDYALIMGCEGIPARAVQPAGPVRTDEQPFVASDNALTYKELLAKRLHAGG